MKIERASGQGCFLIGLSDREVEVLRAVLSEANAADLTPSKYYPTVTETEIEDLYYRLPPLFSVKS